MGKDDINVNLEKSMLRVEATTSSQAKKATWCMPYYSLYYGKHTRPCIL
ncbi:hypothetical protein H5181_06520 [Shewanella sp. SG44-2]|nr:hypothetical protein [Shewanella sp. SG44-2]